MAGSSKTPKDAENKDEELENSASVTDESGENPANEEGESTDELSSEGGTEAQGDDAASDEKPGEEDETEGLAEATSEDDASSETSDVPGVVPAATPVPASANAPAAAPNSGASTVSMVVGGLIAGAIGFLIATFAVPERPMPAVESAPDLSADLAEQTGRIDALLEEFQAFRDAPVPAAGEPVSVDLTPLSERQEQTEANVAEVGSVLATIEDSLAALNERLAAIENEPRVVSPDGSGAMEAQLEAFREELDAVTAEAAAEIEAAKERASEIEAAAAEAAAQADREAALAELRASLESGESYSDLLDRLPDAPEALAAASESGVRPLADLQQSYPDAARLTLQSAENAPSEDGTASRFTAFLRKQTNARSLAPRDGDDTDAVLSRGEAALAAGDLSGALAELDTLQGEVPAEMTDWIAAARARQSAMDAAATLSAETTN